jgi:hypothetical protein
MPLGKQFFLLLILFIIASCSSNKVVTPYHPDISSEYFLADPEYKGNLQVPNFQKAKSLLKKMNYFGIKEEMYCGCEFSDGKISKDAKYSPCNRDEDMWLEDFKDDGVLCKACWCE